MKHVRFYLLQKLGDTINSTIYYGEGLNCQFGFQKWFLVHWHQYNTSQVDLH